MLLFAYLLIVAGLGLAGVSFVNFLLTTGSVVGGAELESLATFLTLQGTVLGLGVAGLGVGLLSLRKLRQDGRSRSRTEPGTGWVLLAGVLLGAALVGGGVYWLSQLGEPTGPQVADTTDVTVQDTTAATAVDTAVPGGLDTAPPGDVDTAGE